MARPKGAASFNRLGPRGSESSRTLERRIRQGVNLAGDTSKLRSPHALDAFFALQQLRIERITNRQVEHVRAVRRAITKDDQRAGRAEVITSFEVEVRGSCGSDVHMGQS